MTDEEQPAAEEPPSFLSSLPNQPITDDIVKQIGESDHLRIREAMGFLGSTPGTIEAFLLDMDTTTHLIVFDSIAEQWQVYESFEPDEMSHQEMVDHGLHRLGFSGFGIDRLCLKSRLCLESPRPVKEAREMLLKKSRSV